MKEALRVLRGFSNYIPEEGFKLDRGILPLVKKEVGEGLLKLLLAVGLRPT